MSAEPSDLVTAIMASVRALRKRERLSARALAEAMAAQGVPMDRATIAKLELGTRANLSVDALWAMAAVFGLSPTELAEAQCPVCAGSPPVGFSCNDCGRGAP